MIVSCTNRFCFIETALNFNVVIHVLSFRCLRISSAQGICIKEHSRRCRGHAVWTSVCFRHALPHFVVTSAVWPRRRNHCDLCDALLYCNYLITAFFISGSRIVHERIYVLFIRGWVTYRWGYLQSLGTRLWMSVHRLMVDSYFVNSLL